VTEDDPTLDVSRNLRAIQELSGHLRDQALHRAAHRELPGGDATVMLGPVSSPEAWENRVETIERLWWESDDPTRPLIGVDEDANWEPPLQTLLFWSEAYRFETSTTTDARPTVESEAGWLLENLRWTYDNEPKWDDFERDIRQARARLEAVLYAGEREERSRVPCIDCETDRDGRAITVLLVVHYGRTAEEDRWRCPRCDRRYDRGAFVRAQRVDGARRGTERHVLVTTAAEALQVHPARIRRLATACDLATRALMVYWPDVSTIRDNDERITA
jgi:hypothetical protein